ncbi:myosin-binding protein C, fast-type-like isoform X1 [Bufo bufo]|uniref:myosin-binding protein C, fast-type-like isoform X1 n=1 Tax=Bufo bufo TaxID=8384 RepID=UPI001ABEE7AA|nr:myosin-binding protein C, fast-type-like isoform X1 [Bufo bufo]XP_040288875.1 myosin-binding protein C, fast-type-like isoform X2 [Bufo bufo]XP_040288883.1 myosin-binding protein C, fast-type-like isoform X1 [Bufo bufo]
MPEPAKPAIKKAPGPAKPAAKPAEKETPKEEPKEAHIEELPPDDTNPEERTPELTGLFIKPPENASVEAGKDIILKATVDASQLAAKPTIKWFKGKWLELGSKSGVRFQFKETVEKEKKIYHFELKIVKAIIADAGGYRCEVVSKDKCDSTSFNIDVEAARDEDNILQSFKRTGEQKKDDNAGELDFSALLKKRVEEKKKEEEPEGIPPDVWEILKKAKPSEYEKICFQYGVTDLRGMLKRLKKVKVEIKKSEVITKKLDPCYSIDKGHRIKMHVEVSNPDVPIKWFKNGQEIRTSAKYVFENVGLKRVITINKCTLADDAQYECLIGDEKCSTELFVKEPPVTIVKPLEDQQLFVGDKVEMEVEVSEEGAVVMWMKDGVELTREESFKFRFKKDGKKHILIINEATKEDTGRYQIMTNGGKCEADLIIEEKQLEVIQGIADLTVKATDQAVFKCEVSDEKVTGKWFKNGVEIRPSKRITMTHKGRIHKLVIDDVKPEDEADYTFIPDGFALTLSAKLNFLEIKVEYVPRQEPPKIHLDCSGGEHINTIIVVAGNKLRFDVPITGEPAPTVAWYKGTEEFYEKEGRVHVEIRTELSSFVIEGAERADEGKYNIVVTNPVGEDKATLIIKVVDVPDPPENVRITSVGEDWASVIWDPPKYDGGKEVTGYLIERKKKGSQRWMKMNFEVYPETSYQSVKMIEGILYEIRVFAVNSIGISQQANTSKPFMPIAPTSEPLHLIVEDVTDTTCTLKWRPPDRIGAGGIDGYLIEFRKEGDTEWTAANTELVERCGYTVKDLPTGEKIEFRIIAVNIAGKSEPTSLTQPVTIREIVQQPKIRLPRHLRQTYIRKVGEQVNLVIPFQGKPRPKVSWSKEGQPLDSKLVSFRTSEIDTILFIRSAERGHSGKYGLSVQIENMEDTATINIRIVEKSGPPQAVSVKEVWGFNAFVEWLPPKDNGNSEVTGYTIQKADKKTMEWFTVFEHNRQTQCTISDLIMGNEYYFRVFSENICGLSEKPTVSKNTAVIQKTGIVYKPLDYKEKDVNMPPKFLTPLIDRTVVAGYSTALNCAVRGFPKPKVIWMKNKMEIRDDPKFIMKHNQGVLTLNIRKPSPFDGGTYTCKAINELGEAEVDCKLEVRVPQ